MSRYLALLLCVVSLCLGATAFSAGPDGLAEDEKVLKAARIDSDGASLLAWLDKATLTPERWQRASAFVRQLGSEEYEKRQQATNALLEMGPVALPLVKAGLAGPDAEVKRRCRTIADVLERRLGDSPVGAVLRVLAARAPKGSTAALLAWLPHARNEYEADEARSALASVALPGGKPDPALLAALKNPEPIRRGVAAEVLARAGEAHRGAVRKMLEDPAPLVRLRAALGLAGVRDREAVPALINLVAELSDNDLALAEEVLFRLAGETLPELPSGDAPDERRKRSEVWRGWWAKNGKGLDLARLSGEATLGYTLAITFEAMVRVSEHGRDGKRLWTIGGLDNAVDACIVPGNRVLIAEYNPARVTERTFDNKIVWEKSVGSRGNGASTCQRLPTGNTFIVTATSMMEVDRSGKEVFYKGGLGLRTAYKYRDGRIGMVTSGGEYVRLDKNGKELKRFPTGISTGNTLGGIDFLPDGGVLVSRTNRVVQLDADGKEVWSLSVARPHSPTRLSNGNTIVACRATREFIEFDRGGRRLRAIKVEGEPWLARRR